MINIGVWFFQQIKSVSEEEIFNGIETIYHVSKVDDGFLIKFNSISNEEYRFDLLKEPNTNIYHLGFSLSSSNLLDYSNLTNRNESIDIFNRLIWILKDITPKLNIDEYCIGATNNPKKRQNLSTHDEICFGMGEKTN